MKRDIYVVAYFKDGFIFKYLKCAFFSQEAANKKRDELDNYGNSDWYQVLSVEVEDDETKDKE